MKIINLLLLALAVHTHAIGDDELIEKWRQFQVDFGKSYRSPVEVEKRLNIFKQNLEDIEAHNSMFAKGTVSHGKGINQFADWTPEEFLKFVNEGLIGKKHFVGKPFKATKSEKVPDSIDWRDKGVITTVKNQGLCKGCWAFSATGALEAHLAKKTGNLVSLSEQNLIDCSFEQGNNGCTGGWMHNAFDYVKEKGIVSEADYPFSQVAGYCKANLYKTVTKISGYVRITENDEEALKTVLGLYGPVTVAIDASKELQLYSTGILVDKTCNENNLNHAVLAVGYGRENGVDYYIVKNSWGSKWGESGYFRLARNQKNMCGVARLAHYPEISNGASSSLLDDAFLKMHLGLPFILILKFITQQND